MPSLMITPEADYVDKRNQANSPGNRNDDDVHQVNLIGDLQCVIKRLGRKSLEDVFYFPESSVLAQIMAEN